MAKALETSGTEPTYLEFFGFTRPPFARLSEPRQIFHTEQYSLLMAHLASATEKPDCLVVVCGADGSGKTTLLNRYITSLGDDVCYATIDDSCKGDKDFYTAFLRQLGFSEITGTSRELWRITKEFLVHRGMAGEPVLIMIDNAHLMSPNVLEQLRRMAAIKVNNKRVLSVVLAGTSDLDRIMDSPAMSQTQFHSQVHFNIRVYTEEETANYVWHRLRLAGASDAVSFSSDAHPLIYRYTGGIPKLINMLCNELLTEALAKKSHEITEELVRSVADDRKLLPHVVPLQGKGRRKSDPDFKLVHAAGANGERITPRTSPARPPVENASAEAKPQPAAGKVEPGDDNLFEQISRLSEQVGELRSARMKALDDVGVRDKENAELHAKFETKAAEAEKLSKAIEENKGEIERLTKALADNEQKLKDSEKASKQLTADLQKERKALKSAQAKEAEGSEKLAGAIKEHEDEIGRLKKTLSDNLKALQQSEKACDKVTADLEQERKAANAAQSDHSKVTAKADELEKLNADLKSQVDKLTADLKEAEANTASHLEGELEKKNEALAELREELDSRDESINDLEKQFKEIQKECASLRLRVAARKTLEDSVSEKESRIADLLAELDSQREQIEKLLAKNSGDKAADGEGSQARQIENLESELDEARKMLTGVQEQLKLSDDLNTLEQASTEVPEYRINEDEIVLETGMHGFPVEVEEDDYDDDDIDTGSPAAEITALEVLEEGTSRQVFRFPEGESRIMIGRSEDSELRLKSEFVSRHHSLIIRSDDGLYIEDLNSFNGTIVNSEKISRRRIRLGDTILIGRYEIKPLAG